MCATALTRWRSAQYSRAASVALHKLHALSSPPTLQFQKFDTRVFPMKILGMVLAGGKGERLRPLTTGQAKPAVPFAAGYRIVDFVLSNLLNSRVSPIFVLGQYEPRSLIEHIRTAWAPWSTGRSPAISVVVPDTDARALTFRGTADAVYKNLRLISSHKPDLVAVFAADHVYRMDVRQMARFHMQHDAEVSIAAVRVPLSQASNFGIVATGPAGELCQFQEKPERPTPIPSAPHYAYASMGNYLFKPHALAELLEEANQQVEADFGRHVMPTLPQRRSAWVYDFARNKVPGIKSHEECGYWRDIGTLDAYRSAQRDVMGPSPRFSLENPEWPIRAKVQCRRGFNTNVGRLAAAR
jgi:glucose-1-phosphate adenylyltransferase